MNIIFLKKLRFIFLIVVLLISASSTFIIAQNDSAKVFPITLFVCSQNNEYVDPVHIAIEIDGKKNFVDQDYSLGDGHNVSMFKLDLTQGRHHIIVTSKNGDAGLDVLFTVNKQLWLLVSYLGKNHFQLLINEGPLGFL